MPTPTPTRLLVQAPVAPLVAEPRAAATQISQALAGHLLDVLETRDDWMRVRGVDGYEAWMHRGYAADATIAADAALPEAAARRAHEGRTSLGCVVRDAAGRRRPLPLGALLAPEHVVETGEAVTYDELRRRHPRDVGAAARTAEARFEGTPYQWGGVTPWGADCSGLVQAAFALHGMPLRRDAWQQAEAGVDAGVDLRALVAGDLLFFSDRPDRRITHVAIALGAMRMVHLALGRGGYAVERMDEQRDAYVATLVERFLFARRLVLGD